MRLASSGETLNATRARVAGSEGPSGRRGVHRGLVRLGLDRAVALGVDFGRQLAAALGAGDQLVAGFGDFGMKPDFMPK